MDADRNESPVGGPEDVGNESPVGGPEDVAATDPPPDPPSESDAVQPEETAEEPPKEAEEPSKEAEEPSKEAEEPPKEAEEPPKEAEESPAAEEPPKETEGPPAAEEPPKEAEEPPKEMEEPPKEVEEPPIESEEPPKEAEAKPEEPKPEEPEVKVATEPEAPLADEEVKAKEPVVPKPRVKVRSIDPSDGVDLAIESDGVASAPPQTVGALFQETYQKYPSRDALAFKENGQWKQVVYSQYYATCLGAAKSFKKLGLEPFGAVAILGFNSPEWFYSNIGAMFAGGLSAGIYATNGPEACAYVASDCKANIIVVENQKQLDKILQVRDQLPHLKAIVQYKGKLSQEYENVYDWEQFMKCGEDVDNSVIEDIMNEQKPTDGALLIYTSGTTGNPKGVMVSHDNLTWTAHALLEHEARSVNWVRGSPSKVVTYLPLSHIAGQMADIYLPMYAASTVYFADPDALKGSLRQTLVEVKPTLFFGVPRVYEKFMEAMQQASSQVTGLKKKLGMWATGKGYQGNVNIQNKRPVPWGWTIANALVLDKIKERLGLQHHKILHVGAAPVHRSVLEYFMKYNLPILELYGMSENTGPATLNTIDAWRIGSVGKPIIGTKLKLDNKDENGEGEICMYGRHVCMGYLNNMEKTKEAIDDEGWLHSGDIGRIDEDGFVFITGRIKELIITSGGENIAPVPIEDRIKAAVPFLSNVMLLGDKRKYLACLVTIKCEMDPETGEAKDEIPPLVVAQLKELGCDATKPSEIANQNFPAIMKQIQAGLDEANKKAVSNAQKVQRFTILGTDFSIPGGELGPTLKLKRRVVVQKYEKVIDDMYNLEPPKPKVEPPKEEEPPKETPKEEPPKETPKEEPPKETPTEEPPKETPKEGEQGADL